MPSKLLGAVSPAYGISTGSGPYKNVLGSYGRAHYDKKKGERDREEEEAIEAAHIAEIKKMIASSGGSGGVSSYDSLAMKGGGRIKKNIDGKAQKGKTKGKYV